MLFSDPAAIDQMVRLFERGLDPMSPLTLLGVSLDEGPAFAADAMQRAFGMPRLPMLAKFDAGARVAVDEDDLLMLAAAMRATSLLAGV